VIDPNQIKSSDLLTVGIGQIEPIWLDRDKTIAKVCDYVERAGKAGCHFVAFGEAMIPGYPFWLERTDGARFNSPVQKELHAHYIDQSVQIDSDHLAPICKTASRHHVAVMVGCIERPASRGGHSLYCSLVYVDADGVIQSVHRKLVPTYEERLSWSPGDGHGLRVHSIGAFTVGGLNCWENWMPMARTALYAQGEDLHVAVWPGGVHNTSDITRFIALESRSFVLSASGLLRRANVPLDVPHRELILMDESEFLANGGSCLAAPNGDWIIEPVVGREELLVATIDQQRDRQERQLIDQAGHYARPDVLQLSVNRQRQSVLSTIECD
jgi:nitrilase